jgi:SAM-dependent methyltransferase
VLKYKEIKTQSPREPLYTDRHVALPRLTTAPFPSPEHEEWVRKNYWMVDYCVFMDDGDKAKKLALELEEAFKRNPDDPAIPGIVRKLKRMRIKNLAEMSALEIWTRSAYQFVGYSGGPYVDKAIAKRLDHYQGEILEAMCGHVSYLAESSGRTVTALDYCQTSLERYPYPARRRIQCDLNQIKGSVTLPFFKEGQLDVVSICFGFKYPYHIGALAREFRRILKPGGILSFVENPHSAYGRYTRRQFNKERVTNLLFNNGYRSVTIQSFCPRFWQKERGLFYHVEAIK